MSSSDPSSTRGTGFVHLNTPATIAYTAGQTVSLSALRQRKTRVECVVLPESMSVWRRAFQRYTKEENYGSYAADVEDERMGSGVILPSLVPQRSGPLRRRAQDSNADTTVSKRDAFFFSAAALTEKDKAAEATTPSSSAVESNDTGSTTTASASSAGGVSASTPASGIAIVSHHKVAGRQQFIYPDHDGVLSAGVVPEIVVTAEDKAEEEAAKAFYISPLAMSEEELAALEELQALWKSRARSHSYLGTQHRNAAHGSLDPTRPDQEGDGAPTGSRPPLGADGRPVKMRRVEGGLEGTSGSAFAEAETAVDDASTLDKELAEALRLADELLRFA